MMAEDAKQHIEQIRREKLEKDSPDLRAALAILAEELNAKDSHFFWSSCKTPRITKTAAKNRNYNGVKPVMGSSPHNHIISAFQVLHPACFSPQCRKYIPISGKGSSIEVLRARVVPVSVAAEA
jgi:hypothetical protein